MALAKDDGPLSAAALVQRLGAAPNALPVLYKLELHLGLAHIALLAAREQLGPSGAGRLAALLESDLSSRFDPNDQAMLAGVISNRLDGYAAAQRNSWVTPSEEFATALFGNVIGRPPRLSDDLNPIYLLHLALIPAVQNFIKRINP